MTRKPEDVTSQDGAIPANPAVENVRTKPEPDAPNVERDASPHEKVHPKVHKSQDEEPVQDATGQPVVEDEP